MFTGLGKWRLNWADELNVTVDRAGHETGEMVFATAPRMFRSDVAQGSSVLEEVHPKQTDDSESHSLPIPEVLPRVFDFDILLRYSTSPATNIIQVNAGLNSNVSGTPTASFLLLVCEGKYRAGAVLGVVERS